MKPTIKKVLGCYSPRYSCHVKGSISIDGRCIGLGDTPKAAYLDWVRQVANAVGFDKWMNGFGPRTWVCK